jgi:hypothetical protein
MVGLREKQEQIGVVMLMNASVNFLHQDYEKF